MPIAIICTPATISGNPSSVAVDVGGAATLTAAGAGSSPRTIRWYRGGVELANSARISGALTSSLAISNVSAEDAGIYTCGSHNACGSQLSTGAALSVNGTCPADLDHSGTVDAADLSVVLSAWGDC